MALLALLALLMLEGEGKEDAYITFVVGNESTASIGRRRPGAGSQGRLSVRPARSHPTASPGLPCGERRSRGRIRTQSNCGSIPGASLPQLPSLRQVKQTLRSSNNNRRTLAARDPRVRVEIVSKEGGTTLTEAAVARGLRWMAQHQNSDGSWSLHRFSRTAGCRNQCRGAGTVRSDSAATSLCLLSYLGAGQTHQVGIFQDHVAKGLRWLLSHQSEDGDLRAGSSGNSGMYAHGQGAIVLCEAYALTRDEQLHSAAQRSIDFVVRGATCGRWAGDTTPATRETQAYWVGS